MLFHDFPRFLGKSGVYLIQPPKMCAGLFPRRGRRAQDLAVLAGVRRQEHRLDHRRPGDGLPAVLDPAHLENTRRVCNYEIAAKLIVQIIDTVFEVV